MKPIGDIVASWIKPVGYDLLHLPCYDEQGNLKPESGCGRRRDALNEAYDFFFNKLKRKEQDGRRPD